MSLNPEARKPLTVDEVQAHMRLLPATVDNLKALIATAAAMATCIAESREVGGEAWGTVECLDNAFASADGTYAREVA